MTTRGADKSAWLVTGNPTAEELAAVVAVLASRPAAAADEPVVRSRWNDPASLMRKPLHPGPGAWASSLR